MFTFFLTLSSHFEISIYMSNLTVFDTVVGPYASQEFVDAVSSNSLDFPLFSNYIRN